MILKLLKYHILYALKNFFFFRKKKKSKSKICNKPFYKIIIIQHVYKNIKKNLC